MPQAGLSICLSDPTAGQSQLLSHYLRICYMLGSGWMLHTQYLSVTDSDLFMQMKSIPECWSNCLRRPCSPCLLWPQTRENRTLKTATAPAVATGSHALCCVHTQLSFLPSAPMTASSQMSDNRCQLFLIPSVRKCLENGFKRPEKVCVNHQLSLDFS